MFIADFKDGSHFSENKGYWDECPDKGITALHLTLPFTVRKVGTGEVLDPSRVTISGYKAYYFANENRTFIPMGGGPAPTHIPPGQGEFYRQVMCGVDWRKDFVCWVEVSKRGDVKFKRMSVADFYEVIRPHPKAMRKGIELDKKQKGL